MAALADFARYVRTEVPMCPEIQILDAVLHAGIDFCKRTKILQETIDLTTVINTPEYNLIPLMASNTVPDEIISVRRDTNIDLDPTAKQDAIESGLYDETGLPSAFYLTGNNIRLVAIPDEVETLVVIVKAYPSEAATTLPDELYSRYRSDIAAGAKSRLMLMANQPWSNMESGAMNKYVFDAAIDTENVRYAKGGGTKPLRSAINSF